MFRRCEGLSAVVRECFANVAVANEDGFDALHIATQ